MQGVHPSSLLSDSILLEEHGHRVASVCGQDMDVEVWEHQMSTDTIWNAMFRSPSPTGIDVSPVTNWGATPTSNASKPHTPPPMDVEVEGLFPVPFMRVRRALVPERVETLLGSLPSVDEIDIQPNELSSRTRVQPGDIGPGADLIRSVLPRIREFGQLLFGEVLEWTIREFWVNRMSKGGNQALHSHANSFVSGILYLTPSHPSARTVFYRSLGGSDFTFNNTHSGADVGRFNAHRWAVPIPEPGDMVLFPSYLLHEVPKNEGGDRVTLAFNAIPQRLSCHDQTVHFSN